jgi:SOS-response transcriptional repressor LexA
MRYTPRQFQVLREIHDFQCLHRYSPTFDQLGKLLKVSAITVFDHLTALERKGAIRRRRYEARSVEIVDQDFLTRLPSNPFFPYLLARVEEGIDRPSGATGRNLITTPSPGLPVRLEALLSTFLPDDADAQPFAGP